MSGQQPTLFERIANSSKLSMLLLVVLSAFFFIGLGHLHLFDWDEINFAEAAREMIASGDYLHVQINFEPFWEKPPLFFWLQVIGMKLFGINEFGARFPNAVFGFIYLITFYWIGRKHFSAKFGLMWSLVFFGSLLPHLYFKSGIIDPVFNYFIFLSIYFLIRVFEKEGKNIMYFALLSGVFSALSVLTKGPVGFLLFGLTFFFYAAWSRLNNLPNWRYFILFILGFGAIIGIWVSVEVAQNGWTILMQFIEYQIELFTEPVAGHEQPFYYHFAVIFIGCFPISIFALSQFWKKRDDTPLDLRKWMLVLFWVVMILFSITTTKIIHYSSMSYAPLSLLATLGLVELSKKDFKRIKLVRISFLSFGLVLAAIITAVPILFMNKELLMSLTEDEFTLLGLENSDKWSGIELLPGIFLFAIVIISYLYIRKNRIARGILVYGSGMGIALLLILVLIMPRIESFSQRPLVSFFEEKANENCYIETFGFKSYGQYFYGRVQLGNPKESKDLGWLIHHGIDRPVYFVSKVTNKGLDQYAQVKLIEERGGYRIYKRELP